MQSVKAVRCLIHLSTHTQYHGAARYWGFTSQIAYTFTMQWCHPSTCLSCHCLRLMCIVHKERCHVLNLAWTCADDVPIAQADTQCVHRSKLHVQATSNMKSTAGQTSSFRRSRAAQVSKNKGCKDHAIIRTHLRCSSFWVLAQSHWLQA